MSTRAQHVATEAALRQARSERLAPRTAIGQYEGINARIAAAEAAVHSAELDLSYCQVRAPFTGLVVNMNISNGAFARAGAEVFTLVDTRTWYVVANFRETQLRHIPSGAPVDLYLQSQPGKHFRGTVVGLGWAVLPENGTSVRGLPRVERSLDWIRLAARFPVRIKVENPDDSFRIGASAVATVSGTCRGGRPMTPSALLDFLRRELAPTPGRGSATFRLTLACLAATIPILTHRIPLALLVMILMYLITQEDTAATLIGSILGCDRRDHRSGSGPARLGNFIGYRVAASLLPGRVSLRRAYSSSAF